MNIVVVIVVNGVVFVLCVFLLALAVVMAVIPVLVLVLVLALLLADDGVRGSSGTSRDLSCTGSAFGELYHLLSLV